MRRCACGCARPTTRPNRPYASRACFLTHRKARDGYRHSSRAGGLASAAVKRKQVIARVSQDLGVPVTRQSAQWYRQAFQLGYHGGYQAGVKAGKRLGWAEALGERRTA